ncbi:MAG: 50S ribosomal protein L3 [Clostridia bacterium]|nr:50S ribosomal protein L3 [Clostridia bacterium]
MKKGIIGKKIGMTQIFDERGNAIPVTVIEAGPCTVVQKKTAENDGYDAVQLGFEEVKSQHLFRTTKGGKKRHNYLSAAEKGHFRKWVPGEDLPILKHLKEFRFEDCSGYESGKQVTVDTFTVGEKVDVTGLTKGHGYTGAVKRWNQHTLCSTHGVGPIHREVGSMGPNSTPSRVYKNKHMAGQYGNEQVTILNLKVVKIDSEKNLIAVKGAIPGAKDGIVFIRDSIKG